MDFGKRDRAFLTMERHQQKQWTFTVTVRRSFYQRLLSFFVRVPTYQHLPGNGYRSLRVYNVGGGYAGELMEWLLACEEPFDLLVPGSSGLQTYRYNSEGALRSYLVFDETRMDQVPSWEDQERNLAIYKTNQLLDM